MNTITVKKKHFGEFYYDVHQSTRKVLDFHPDELTTEGKKALADIAENSPFPCFIYITTETGNQTFHATVYEKLPQRVSPTSGEVSPIIRFSLED